MKVPNLRKDHVKGYLLGLVGIVLFSTLFIHATPTKQISANNASGSSSSPISSSPNSSPQSSTSPNTNSSTSTPTPSVSLPSVTNNETQAENQQVLAQEQARCATARNYYNSGLQASADELVNYEKSIATDLQNQPLLSFATELSILNEHIGTTNQYNLTLLYPQYEGTITANSCSPVIPNPRQVPPCSATDYISIGYCETQVYPSIGLP